MRALPLCCLALLSCLPETTRPEPGVADIYMAGSPELTSGVTTSDGWTLSFSRVIGSAAALPGGPGRPGGGDEGSCDLYSGNARNYALNWLDPTPQKLVHIAAIGTCPVRVLLPVFGEGVRLGPGVAEADLRALQGARPTPLLLAGVASRGSELKRFELALDQFADISSCHAGPDRPLVALASGDQQRFTLRLRPERLFLDRPGGSLRFDAIAAADAAPPDDLITSEELSLQLLEPLPHDGGTYQPTETARDLWSWMTEQHLAHLIAFDGGGSCDTHETLRLPQGIRGDGPL